MVLSNSPKRIALFALLLGSLSLSACVQTPSDWLAEDNGTTYPVFVNGDFESNSNGVAPSGWTVSTYLNATGLAVVPPVTQADLQLSAGGYPVTVDVNGIAGSLSDPDVSTLKYPKFGTHSLVVNSGDGPWSTGNSGAFAVTGSTVTFTRTTGANFVAGDVGKRIVITGATSASNNGLFIVATRISNTRITYTNAGAVTEAYTGNYALNAGGRDQNVNKLSQTMTLMSGDINPIDNQIHIRWVLAPVLQDGGHVATQQPYFFYAVTNVTTGVVLRHDFNFATQTGVPWQSVGAGCPGAGCINYTDWQLIDVAPGASAAIGDQIRVDLFVSGCQPNGHWGRVYVDSFGATVPGFIVTGSAPTYSLNNANMDYSLHYQNNSGGLILGAEVDFSLPAGTTFVSASESPNNGTCVASSGGTGAGPSVVTGATAGYMRVTGVTGMSATSVGSFVTIAGAASATNNGLFKIAQVNSATSVDLVNAVAVMPDANNGNAGMTWSARPNVKCPVGNLATGSGGNITLTVNINASTEGVMVAGTYWTQGTTLSPLYGQHIDTVVSGPAATISVLSGAPQSATVNTAFTNKLIAVVKDAAGYVVPNANVTWTPPASGASATLTAGTGTTDLSGQVSTNATAGTVSGTYNVNASVPGVATAGAFALTNTVGAAANITVTSGGTQTGLVNTNFASPVVVTITDSFGNPLSGQTVVFTAPAQSGASATFTNTFVTNSAGRISIVAKANGNAGGPYNVTVSLGSLTTKTLTFTNTGAAASITVTSGGGQSALTGAAFADPIVVTIKDGNGLGVFNQTVVFTAPAQSGASATFANSFVTNAQGQVSIAATANANAGSYNTTVSSGALSTKTFALINIGAPASITVTSGSGQSATVGTAFTNPIVITIKDSAGTGVPGKTVVFTAPAQTGASATFTGSFVTNASGQINIAATANAHAGSYTTTVASGTLPTKTFTLTNTAGAATTVTVTSGDGQTAAANTAFATSVVVTVTDAFGNGVAGETIAFGAPAASGASATFTGSFVTNVNGQISVAATANEHAGGPYVVNVTDGALSATSFVLTNSAASAASISVSSGDGQSADINTAFGAPIVIMVKDSYGNGVSGVTVALTAPTGASATFSGSLVTDATGQIVLNGTANTYAGGPYSIVMTSGTLPASSITLTNTFGTLPTIASPAPSAIVGAGNLTVTGTAAAGSIVTVTAAGITTTTTALPDGTYSAVIPGPLPGGSTTISVTETDASGNVSPPVTQPLTVDTSVSSAPVVLTPANGSSEQGPGVIVTGTAEPGSLVIIKVVNGTTTQTATTTANLDGTYTATLAGPYNDGPATVSVTATNALGNTSPATSNAFTFDSTRPSSPVITSPAPGVHVTPDGDITVTGTGTPGATITVTIGGLPVITVVNTDGTFTATLPGPFPTGPLTISATETDAAGNVSLPSTVDFVAEQDGSGAGASIGGTDTEMEQQAEMTANQFRVLGSGCQCNGADPTNDITPFLIIVGVLLLRRQRLLRHA